MTLKDFFIKYPKIAIAFSGGTDSAYLCYMAKKYAKEMTAEVWYSHLHKQEKMEAGRM